MSDGRAPQAQLELEVTRLRLDLERLRALNALAIDLSAATTTQDVWLCIAEKLREITDAFAVGVSAYTASAQALTVEHVALHEHDRGLLCRFEELLGRPLIGMHIPVSPLILEEMLSVRVHTAAGMHESTFGLVPPEVARALNETFGLGPFCNLALIDGGELLGTVVIVLPRGADPLSTSTRMAIAPACIAALCRASAEDARRRTSQRHQALLAAIPDIVIEVDRNKIYTWANSQGIDFFGADVVGKEAAAYFVGAQDTYAKVAPLFAGEVDLVCLESMQRRRDGEPRVLAWRSRALRDGDGTVTGVISSARDITDERRAFDEANAFLDATRAVLREQSFDATARTVFESCRALIGAPVGYLALLGADAVETVILETGEPGSASLPVAGMRRCGMVAAAAQSESAIYDNDVERGPHGHSISAGHPRLHNVLFAPLRIDGQTVGLVGFANKPGRFEQRDAWLAETFGELVAVALRDRRKDEALRGSEERFRLVFENIADGIALTDPQTRKIAMANAAMCRLLGYSVQEMCGLGIADIHPTGGAPGQTGEFQRLLAGERGPAHSVAVRRKDGTTFLAHVTGTQVEIAGCTLILTCFRDVTEIQRLQASVAQADRLASVGMLAAGVAHEINNPLAFVLCSLDDLATSLPRLAEVLRRCYEALRGRPYGVSAVVEPEALGALFDLATCDELVARAREAQAGGVRIKEIVRGLSTFSRIERSERTPVRLDQPLECAVNLARNEIKFRARLVKDYGSVPPILASDGKLAQVFLNLLINAAHAIDEGTVEHNEIRVRTWVEGESVCAEVADTGKGIAREDLDRIFDPFFTTKEVGAGSGLGLTICRNFITELGGDITVESTVGSGTRFVVRLPVGQAPVAALADRPHDTEVQPQATRGRILIVDDEAAILNVLKRLLSRDHDVVTAESGEQGQAILGADQGFDLIICDLMMPKMSGMELHEWLAAHHPALARQVIFMTGGVFTPKARDYLDRVDNLKIEKPFDGIALRKTVAERIAAQRGQPADVMNR